METKTTFPYEPSLVYELIRTYADDADKSPEKEKKATYVTCSPDGNYVVCGYEDGDVIVFDRDNGQIVKKIKAHKAKVCHIEFDAEPYFVCTAGADSSIKFFSYGDFTFVKEVLHPSFYKNQRDYEMRFILFDNEKEHMYFGTDSGCLFRYDFGSDNNPFILVSPNDMYPPEPYFLTCGIFSPDKKYIVYGSGYSLKVVNLISGKVERIIGHTSHYINDVVFHPKEKNILATWSQNGVITYWNYYSGKKLTCFEAGDSHYCHLSFSPDGTYLASANCDNKVRIWNAATKHLLTEIETKLDGDGLTEAHSDTVKTLTFINEDHLLTGSMDGTAKIWYLSER